MPFNFLRGAQSVPGYTPPPQIQQRQGGFNPIQFAPQQDNSGLDQARQQVMLAGQMGTPIGAAMPQPVAQFQPFQPAQAMQAQGLTQYGQGGAANAWQQFAPQDMSAMSVPSNAGAGGFNLADKASRWTSGFLGNKPQLNSALATSGSSPGVLGLAGIALNAFMNGRR